MHPHIPLDSPLVQCTLAASQASRVLERKKTTVFGERKRHISLKMSFTHARMYFNAHYVHNRHILNPDLLAALCHDAKCKDEFIINILF